MGDCISNFKTINIEDVDKSDSCHLAHHMAVSRTLSEFPWFGRFEPPKGGRQVVPSVDLPRGLAVRSMLVVPMYVTSSRIVGAVMVMNKADAAHPEDTLALTRACSGQA